MTSDTRISPGEAFHLMTTQTLVEHAARGNERAIETLFDRFRPRLVRWTRGQLPRYARDLRDTEDLLHDVFLSALPHLPGFQQEGGGLLSYLCKGVLNRKHNEIRRVLRKPEHIEADDTIVAATPSALEELVGREQTARYRAALSRLSPMDQDLIIGRLEMETSFAELALLTGKPSSDAARMAFERAVARLVEFLAEDASGT